MIRTRARAACLAAVACAALAACRGHAGGPKPSLGDEGGATGAPARLEDLHGSLVSIDVAGLPRERAATAKSVLHSEVGGTFDRGQVASDVRALWGMGSVTDVRAEGRPASGGVALRYTVREQPRIRSIDVRGSAAIPAAQWVAQMPLKSGDFCDPTRLNAIRGTMLDQLRQAGFAMVKVTWAATDTKGSGVDVVFDVAEGPMMSLAQLDFRGNKAVPRKALLGIMAQGGGVAVGGRYWRDAIQRGLEAVNAHYFDLGYVNVGVGPVDEKLAKDGKSVTVTVPIVEGDQFRLGELSFQGALVATPREYASRFGVRKGQVFSRRKIAEGLERLRELHRTKGKPNADLIPVTELEAGKKRIKVTIQVVQGPQGAPSGQPGPAQGQGQPAPSAPPSAPPAPAPSTPAPSAPPPPAQPAPTPTQPGPGKP